MKEAAMLKRVPAPTAKISGRILILENSCVEDETLRSVLQSYGLEVVVAGEDSEVLAFLENGGIDIVLLDGGTQALDGFKLCRCIKQNQQTAHIPVLLMAATNDHDDRIASIEAGIDDVLCKHITTDELLLRVRNAVADKKMYTRLYTNYYQLRRHEESRDKLINSFVCDMSGILQSIFGSAELFKIKNAHKLNHEAVTYLEKIEDNCERLVHICCQFRKTIHPEKEDVHVDMVVGRGVERLADRAGSDRS